MKVADAMTRNAVVVAPHATVSEMARVMRERDTGVLPVVEDGRLVGVVTDRDIVAGARADGAAAATTTAREIMSSEILYCDPADGIEDVLERMARVEVRGLPVIDGDSHLVGVLSLGDCSRAGSGGGAGQHRGGVSGSGQAQGRR